MRTVLLVFLLYSSTLGFNSFFDKINGLKKGQTEEFESSGDLTDADGDDVNKFKEFWDKLKQEQEQRINEFKEKLEEQKKAKEAAKQEEREEFKKKWDEIKQGKSGKVEEIKSKIKEQQAAKETPVQVEARSLLPKDLTFEEKKQLVDELLAVFEGVVNATKIRKAEKKKERQEAFEQLKPHLKEFFTDLKEKFAAWKTAKDEEKAQRWEDVKAILSSILQKAIEKKKEKDAAARDFWNKVHEKITGSPGGTLAPAVAPAQPEVKATFFDRVTGTSSWQNVTWIMLSICVFLAVALLGTVLYQNAQRKKYEYQRLPGDDRGAPHLYPKLEMQQEF